mmetsp:Transcript_54652/g.150517  ORF Transcript_54652/g.150517 Transcript_54652/m.150517 type:complete len:129 (-) Transcript_54652:743-1129(-)
MSKGMASLQNIGAEVVNAFEENGAGRTDGGTDDGTGVGGKEGVPNEGDPTQTASAASAGAADGMAQPSYLRESSRRRLGIDSDGSRNGKGGNGGSNGWKNKRAAVDPCCNPYHPRHHHKHHHHTPPRR